MSQSIERPNYYEGQILGATDLSSAIDYSRGKWERHDRYLHSWGIVTGLELELNESTKRVVVKVGSAVDGHGREIVLSSDVTLEESKFSQVFTSQNATDSYPVFIQSVYEEKAPNTQLTGSCNINDSTRVSEAFEITFGRKGEEQNLDDQAMIDVGDSPSNNTGSSTWRILLGYVQAETGTSVPSFTGATPEEYGVGRRYAGVYADNVIARGGKLTLQTNTSLSVGTPMVWLDEEEGGQIRFGLYKGNNELNELFKVDDKGNLTVPGKLEGALSTGATLVESGIATDGTLLPLPTGVTQDQIDNDQVRIHIHVTPRYHAEPPQEISDTDWNWMMLPLECYVENRRVRCRVRWMETHTAHFHVAHDLPGTCDYTVTVYAA